MASFFSPTIKPTDNRGLYGAAGFFKLNPYHKPVKIGIPDRPPGSKPIIVNPVDSPPKTPGDGFHDYYGDILTKLATLKDLALGNLSTDLATRTRNVQGIVDAARAPLNSNYSTAIQEAAAVNDAVANRLGTQGTSAGEDLRAKLASLGQDPSAATADLSKYYSGLGGANYAMDAGDVQRLIGRQAEENTLLNKQPGLMATQMNTDYSTNVGNVISDFLDKSTTLQGQSADAHTAYDNAQAQIKADNATNAEKTYWDNYWQKQDLLFKRWQTNIASGDKAAANATKKQIDAAQRQSAVDIANIRAGATTASANTRAAATTQAAATRAAATKAAAATRAAATKANAKNPASNVNRQRAYKAALDSVIDPKVGVIRSGINPTGYNADWTMTRIIHGVLKSYGINPQSPQGRSVTASIMSQASGRKFARDPNSRYKYDPNWAKAAKKAAAKRKIPNQGPKQP